MVLGWIIASSRLVHARYISVGCGEGEVGLILEMRAVSSSFGRAGSRLDIMGYRLYVGDDHPGITHDQI